MAAGHTEEVNARRIEASREYALTPVGNAHKIKGGNAALHSHRGASSRMEWEYGGHRFRSSWERDFAYFLDLLGTAWEYEPKTYNLSGGKCYTPDFLVHIPGGPSVVVEIKGVDYGLDKYLEFTRTYPETKQRPDPKNGD